MRMMIIAALAGVALLAGCGSSEPDRTEGGAATGAATGAAIGILGGPPGILLGGLIGGAAGAGTGAAVDSRDFNLGPPPWSEKP